MKTLTDINLLKSKSKDGHYVDNPRNRAKGIVGLPYKEVDNCVFEDYKESLEFQQYKEFLGEYYKDVVQASIANDDVTKPYFKGISMPNKGELPPQHRTVFLIRGKLYSITDIKQKLFNYNYEIHIPSRNGGATKILVHKWGTNLDQHLQGYTDSNGRYQRVLSTSESDAKFKRGKVTYIKFNSKQDKLDILFRNF